MGEKLVGARQGEFIQMTEQSITFMVMYIFSTNKLQDYFLKINYAK